MLFNSYEFLLLFLPLTCAGLIACGRWGHNRMAVAFMVGASLFFYGWGNSSYLWLILASIIVNYTLGFTLDPSRSFSPHLRKALLAGGIIFNLVLLGYYKYAGFISQNIASLLERASLVGNIIQPLAISFFTFQQIAFLLDTYKGLTTEYRFRHYVLFVIFFPQLISGPIVRCSETMPQYVARSFPSICAEHVSVGLTLFFIGLFKKVIIADSIAQYVSPIFQAAEQGMALGLVDAWAGALAYTFQLYFDFSGYTDMALGVARIFGIYLPLNFNSPYKATSVIDFWKRWHITLSRFFRDYLYIPLGGNRKGKARQYVNIMVTMLLCGLWHGANWTFVVWGALHGIYLVINHFWRALRQRIGVRSGQWWDRILGQALTFVAVVSAWVIFRAESFPGAFRLLQAMFGLQGVMINNQFTPPELVKILLGVSGIVFFLPNAVEFVDRKGYAIETTSPLLPNPLQRLHWQPTVIWMLLTAACALSAIYNLSEVREFIYSSF